MSDNLHIDAILFEHALDASLIHAGREQLQGDMQMLNVPTFLQRDARRSLNDALVEADALWLIFIGEWPLHFAVTIFDFVLGVEPGVPFPRLIPSRELGVSRV